MPDREKTALGIREMIMRDTWRDIDADRPRYQRILNDCIAMLKQQDAVEPHSHLTDDADLYFTCGKCGNVIWSETYKYCPTCGLKVAWNGEDVKFE